MDFRVILFGIGATFIGYNLWRSGSRASSLIRGTATAKIGSAAKGYAEVQGRASATAAGPLRDPITHEHCLWFSVVTEKFSFWDKCRWRTVKSARSSSPFVIDDGTGRCLVAPAEVSIDERDENTIVKDAWNLRHKVWWIREGDPVFAIGYLQRTSDLTAQGNARETGKVPPEEQVLMERATRLLRTWKQNPRELIAKFDANGDGKIDPREWDAARAAAREMAAERTPVRPRPAPAPQSHPTVASAEIDITHRLIEPPDGRPFLLSTHGEASLVSRSRSKSFWGLVFFVIGVITLVALLRSCVED